MNVSKRIDAGMNVQISPDYAPREEFGYILGKVESVGGKPVTEDEITQTFGNINYVMEFITGGNMVQVKVVPEQEKGRLKWSNKKGENVSVTNGSYCDLLIVVKERKPYELIF